MIQADLARAMNVGKVSLGATIKHLEGAGLVSKETDPDDLRFKRVIVTDKGLDATIQMTVIVEKLNQNFWKGIEEDSSDFSPPGLCNFRAPNFESISAALRNPAFVN